MRLARIIVSLSMGAACTNLCAQVAGSDENQGTRQSPGLEEIIVTAERRAETLQRTPISIVALNQDAIEKAGIENIEDMQNFIPNLTISGSVGGRSTPDFVIRGIGSASTNRVTGDRGVGLYIDDVYFPRTQGSLLNVLDVERIEVLRGPQGTLFGKNNTGGAVRYITRRPTHNYEGFVKVSLGNDALQNITALANVPLSDEFAVRAQYSNLNHDGPVKQGKVTLGNTDDEIFRIVGRYDPNDRFTLDVGYTFVDSKSNGPALDTVGVDQPEFDFAMVRRLSDALVAFGEGPIVTNDPRIVLDDFTVHNYCLLDGDGDPYTDTGGTTTLDFGPLGIEESAPGCATPRRNKNHMAFADLTYDLSENLSLRLLTGYTGVKYHAVRQWVVSGTQASVVDVESDTFSQEIQLSGAGDRFNWVVGGIYSKEKAKQSFINYWLNPFQADFDVDAGFKRRFTLDTTSLGAFAQGTFDVTDRVALTGGIRYSSDEKDFIYRRHNRFQGNPLTNNDTWSSVDYRVSVEFNVTEDAMVYGTYSTAYRAGGFNDGASAALDINGNGIADPGENNGGILPFDPEHVDSLEFGVRSEWFDRLRINGTLFSMQYTDIQTTVVDRSTIPPTPLIANIGSADIKGAEAELLWSISENFILNGSAGYLFENEVGVGGAVDRADRLPNAPEISYNLGIQYENIMANGSSFSASINYAYTDEFSVSSNPSQQHIVDSRGLVNSGIDYKLGDDRWAVGLSCTNCTNKTFAYGGNDLTPFWDSIVENRAPSRRVQAYLKYSF